MRFADFMALDIVVLPVDRGGGFALRFYDSGLQGHQLAAARPKRAITNQPHRLAVWFSSWRVPSEAASLGCKC